MLNHVFKTASGWNLWIYLMHPPGKNPITSIHNEHIAFRVDQSDLTLQILAWSLWLKVLHLLALRYWFVATMCLRFASGKWEYVNFQKSSVTSIHHIHFEMKPAALPQSCTLDCFLSSTLSLPSKFSQDKLLFVPVSFGGWQDVRDLELRGVVYVCILKAPSSK